MLENHILLIVVLLAITTTLNGQLSPVGQTTDLNLHLDSNGFFGCYVNEKTVSEFNIHMSHLDPANLVPSQCKWACQSMGYDIAAFESGSACLCKNGTLINSLLVNLENCMQIPCPGDPSLTCGSDANFLVYKIGKSYIIKDITKPNDTELLSGSDQQITVTYGTANLIIGTYSLNYKYAAAGSQIIRLAGTETAINDPSAHRTAIKSPVLVEPISNVEINCSLYEGTGYHVRCGVTYNTGSHVVATFNYGDQTIETINIDLTGETVFYGYPDIPQITIDETVTYSDLSAYSYEKLNESTLETVVGDEFILSNTYIKEYGKAIAIELYAHSSGDVSLFGYRYDANGQCSSLRSSQNYDNCESESDYNKFSCTLFCVIDEICGESSVNKWTTYNHLHEKKFFEVTLSLNKGYNYFSIDAFVQPGDVFALNQYSGKVAVDRLQSNKLQVSDFWIENYALVNKDSQGGNKINFYARLTVTPRKQMSTFKTYASQGNYTISVSLDTAYPSLNPLFIPVQNSTDIIIEDPIEELYLLTLFCQLNRECIIEYSIASGSNVVYNLTFNGTNIITTETDVLFTFTESGLYPITIVATNHVSKLTINTEIECIDKLIGLYFHAGTLNKSTSVLGTDAAFRFYLKNGMGYNCEVNYGDGSTDSFNDLAFNYNDTIFLNTYAREDKYFVTINCSGLTNFLYSEFYHYVQRELTGLALTKPGAVARQPYYVEFQLLTGSSIDQIDLYFDGVLDNGTTFDPSTLTGRSSFHPQGDFYPGVHDIFINMSNIVSRAILNTTFQISSPIINPSFKFSPDLPEYSFPYTIDIIVSLESGANARVQIYTDEELDSTVPTFDILIEGKWETDLKVTYQFLYPGAHNIYINVSNSINFVMTDTQRINLETPVDSLVAGLFQEPVIYLLAGFGTAEFKFSFTDITKSGTDAKVTFWPGDAANDTYGPFEIGMNFVGNYNEAPLSYRYPEVANFTALFLIENRFGKIWRTITFEVIPGLDGFFIDCVPKRMVRGLDVEVSAFVVQGNNVNFTWYLEGKLMHNQMRQSKVYNKGDPFVMTGSNFNTERKYLITVVANDEYVSYTENFAVSVEFAVDFSFTVTPDVPVENDRTTGKRTFVLSLKLLESKATEPKFVVDWGDGTDIESEQPLSKRSFAKHVYAKSGIYNIKVTGFNQVSEKILNTTVELLSPFTGFKCKPYYRLFPVDGTLENPYTANAAGVYVVRKENNVRFQCTWDLDDSVATSFTISYANSITTWTASNITSLMKISKGYVIPLDKSVFNFVTDGNVTINVSNSLYQESFRIDISAASSILNIRTDNLTDSTLWKSNLDFKVNYDSLGIPSCALVEVTSEKIRYANTIGTYGDSAQCKKYFRGYVYNGAYNLDVVNKVWTFTTQMKKMGLMKFKVNVTNAMSQVVIMRTIAVALNFDCRPPGLSIANRSEHFYIPTEYKRTEMIVIESETALRCSGNLKHVKKWLIYEIDPITVEVLRQIELIDNPTQDYSQLVLQPGDLEYGLYKFVFQATMDVDIYQSELEHYIKIIPSGIVVFSLKGGISEITRGTRQEITFDPAKYSFDFDKLVSPKTLTYKFYCQSIDNGVENGWPMASFTTKIDLLSFKKGLYPNFPMHHNTTCFDDATKFEFDETEKIITIKENSLVYYKNRAYQIWIETEYLGTLYSQKTKIVVKNVGTVPKVELKCKFQATCKPFPSYQLINPSTQQMITSICKTGCQNVSTITYRWNLFRFFKISPDDVQEKWIQYVNDSYIKGSDTSELTISSAMFTTNPDVERWKVEFALTAVSKQNGIANGASSLILQLNKIPYNGTCSVTPENGTSLQTTFIFKCTGWKDDDGTVEKYAFYSAVYGSEIDSGIGVSKNGELATQLPQGADEDEYRMSIYVQIIDNDEGAAYYTYENQLTVEPNTTRTDSLFEGLTGGDPTEVASMLSGSPQQATQNLLALSAALNSQSKAANVSRNASERTPEEEAGRAKRAAIRTAMINYVNSISISDVSSVKAQASMITGLTGETTELARDSSDQVTNQAIRLTNSLSSFSEKSSVEDLKHAAAGIMGSMGNIQGGVNDALAGRAKVLESDIEAANALPAEFDADIENYWTNPGNFRGPNGEYLEGQALLDEVNLQKQKRAAADIAQKNARVMESVQQSVSNHMSVGDDFAVNTPTLSINIVKASAKNISSNVTLGNSQVNAPTYCEMIGEVVNKTEIPPGTPITDLVYDPEEQYNCENKILTVQSQATPSAPSGNNGNDAAVGSSGSISFGLNDEFGQPIKVSNSAPIDLWITKPTVPETFIFERVNASSLFKPNGTEDEFGNSTNATLSRNKLHFLQNGLKIFTNDASLHIHIKPDEPEQGYLMVVKFNGTPNYNISHRNYDYLKILCPNSTDVVDDGNDTYYLLFLNIAQVGGYKGPVGFGIRELSETEQVDYCRSSTSDEGGLFLNTSTNVLPPFLDSNFTLDFNYDFEIRIFSSGCYYFDLPTGNWKSDGMEILRDTSALSAHCVATHLTEFAGGFAVVVPSVNFEAAFANASFLDNPVIYSTIIGITILYIILAIVSRYKDYKDKTRFNIMPLEDNKPEDNYFYELIILTGTRAESGTNSKVRIIITGEYDESEIRLLNENLPYAFKRGSVDSFVLSVNKPLGSLNYVRIWHDNSGKKDKASWFLKDILIHDLQTREKFYFFNQRWLAVEREDGHIDRVIPAAGEAQKKEIKSLAAKQVKTKITDGHLWFSILAKPAHSAFSRYERTTCCFVLMYISMLMNILYYGASDEIQSEGLQIGPIKLTLEQVLIGVISNLITFPPTFLIVQLFRRSRSRYTRTSRLRKIIKESFEKSHESDEEGEFNFNDLDRMITPAPKNNIQSNDKAQILENEERNQTSLAEEDYEQEHEEEEEQKEVDLAEKHEQPKPAMTFPWWCSIIAVALSYFCMIISMFFIIVKGLEFGNEKVTKWVTSLIISFFTSVFVTQPIQAIGVAVVLSLIFRKYTDDIQEDKDDDGKSLNDYAKWQKFQHRQKSNYKFTNEHAHKVSQLTVKQLREARLKRIEEIKIYRYLRDIVVNVLFMIILFILAYGINGSSSFEYQSAMERLFNAEGSFDDIARVEDFYEWAQSVLAPALRVSTYYNGDQAYYMAGFLADFSSRLIGYATLRQVRVDPRDCKMLGQMAQAYGACYPELNRYNEEKRDFSYGWTERNDSYEAPNGYGPLYDAFKYKSAFELKGSAYQGAYGTYGGGGHVYELRGKLSYLIGNISMLQQYNWIDRSTRAVFIEFSAYNTNINLFVVTTMLIEILPSGNILNSRKFECINLMETGSPAVKIILMVLYMLFVIYFALKSIKQFLKQGWSHFLGFWTIIDWLLIVFSCISVQCFVNRIEKASEISEYFIKTKGYSYMKLQDINLANQLIVLTLSCCCAFQTLKFLQLLRFNNRIYMLALTLNNCIPKLGGFVLVFSVIWFAFVQLMYLFFNERSSAYSDVLRSVMTSLQILLGKFEMDELLRGNPLFGSILFTSYNILIVLLLMNTFISIICDSFAAVQEDLLGKPNDFEPIDYFKAQFFKAKEKIIPKKTFMFGDYSDDEEDEELKEQERQKSVNQNLHLVLSQRVDKLVNICGVILQETGEFTKKFLKSNQSRPQRKLRSAASDTNSEKKLLDLDAKAKIRRSYHQSRYQ